MNLENISLAEILIIGTAVGVGAGKLLAYTAEKASDIYHKDKPIYIDFAPSIIEKIVARTIGLLPRKTK